MGSDKDSELYKGIVSFMIVGLTDSIPYVVKALTKMQINGEWLKELLECLLYITCNK